MKKLTVIENYETRDNNRIIQTNITTTTYLLFGFIPVFQFKEKVSSSMAV